MSSGTAEAPPLGEASGGPHRVVDILGPVAEEHTTNHPDRKGAKSPPNSERSQAPPRNVTEKSQLEAQVKPVANSDKQPLIDSQTRGLGIGAEVWNTYVKEADKSDKELSEGWNKMLDVILLFAALFSAISTAFVLESSKDLKPDPAESSAARLLTITHLLVAMSNQSAVTTVMLPPDEPEFTPSTSALAVNVLWFLSLILSIAVTLIAMLAKEWCHLFMAGRDGEMHDQARKRQQRLEGLKRWKMEGVIPALPTLMHLALFLFAVGLCIYLWNIHAGVAIPVILISVAAGVLYLSAIVLPFIHDYCPYETALSKQLKPWVRAWFYAWFRSGQRPESDEKTSHSVPMDDLTGRVLCWLVSNCENPRAVDVALQSIAGADDTLNCARLMACNVALLILSRIQDCFAAQQLPMATSLTRLRELSTEQYGLAMSYARSLIVLIVNTRFFEGHPSQGELLQVVEPLGLFHNYQYNALLELACTAQKLQIKSPSYTPLFRSLLHSLLGQLVAVPAPPDSQARIGLLKQTLETMACFPASNLREESFPQPLAVVALRLNTSLLAHFETEDPSLLPLFHDRPEATGKQQRTRLEDLSSTCLLIMGLIGVIEASQRPGCVGAFGPDDMDIVFEQLHKLEIGWGSSASFAPLGSAGTFDLRRYTVETVLEYHRQELTRNSATNESVCSKLLRSILTCSWDDGSWITDLVFNALTGSDNDGMRDITAEYLSYNSESASRHPQVYNILYDMFHMSRYKSLSYFEWSHFRYFSEITQSFHSIAITNSDDSKNMKGAIDALLERLVNNSLLGTLILAAYGSEWSYPKGNSWQGLCCGRTTRFWGERIIALAQRSNSQQAASNDPSPPTVAGRIRKFCPASGEFPDEVEASNELKAGDIPNMDPSTLWNLEDRWSHLLEFKKVLLREIAPKNEPQQTSISAV